MRMSKVSEWIAGGLAGCPGIVHVTAPGDPPTPASTRRGRRVNTARRGRRVRSAHSTTKPPDRPRSRWVTAAAVVLVVSGGMGIVYAPFLTGGAVWRFLGFGISSHTIVGVLSIATGIGVHRLYGWARIAAVLLSAYGLLFLHLSALAAAIANGAWYAIDWLGIVGTVVVLFAVLRRWPPAPAGAD